MQRSSDGEGSEGVGEGGSRRAEETHAKTVEQVGTSELNYKSLFLIIIFCCAVFLFLLSWFLLLSLVLCIVIFYSYSKNK